MKSPLVTPPPRTAGQGLDAYRNDLILDGMATIFMLPAILWFTTLMESFAAWRNAPRMPGVYAFMAAVMTVYAVFAFRRLRRKSSNLKLGRDGEREVGYVLSTLDVPGARVFHDIPAGKFNLDHVLVCDRGIFVVETKTWRKPEQGEARLSVLNGSIYRNGRPTSKPVDQAMYQARWLSGQLKKMTGKDYACQPVVVTPGWFVQEPMDDATRAKSWVLNPTRLLGYIQQSSSHLSPEDVRLIADRMGVLVRQERPPG